MRGLKSLGPLLWAIIIIVLVVVLYFSGGVVTRQSTTIGGCHAEWDTISRSVQSAELCPVSNQTCIADPYVMQHNAVVDALLCACAKASPAYSDVALNKEIEDAYKANTNSALSVQDVCEGGTLTNWKYR